jgi:predicted TIM-barrel fold metal-dependent hydrolase
VDLLMYMQGSYPYAQDLLTLAYLAEQSRVDRYIVFSGVSYLALDLKSLRKGKISDKPRPLDKIPYEFENRRLMNEVYDLFPKDGKKAIPFVMLDPSRKQKLQAKALQSLRKDFAFYGFKIQSTIIQSPIINLLKEGRCFLDLAREWDIPFIIHSSVGPNDFWAQAADILKIAEQNPDIRFCLAHSCRFDREYIDRVAELPNTWFDCSAHVIHCQCAVQNRLNIAPKERRFKSDYRHPAKVLQDLAATYPNKLIWGSDSPFQSWVSKQPDGTLLRLSSSYETEVKTLRTLSSSLVRKIACDNTLKYLKTKLPK